MLKILEKVVLKSGRNGLTHQKSVFKTFSAGPNSFFEQREERVRNGLKRLKNPVSGARFTF